ncbi:MAG TPA: ABC transporter substrate-binding protein [Alphaproteobacteria bacterium]|nr:ABC transporter substrate-binding protein [Alphaproteobacteria bacterium]
MARLNTVYYDRHGRRMSRRRFAGLAAATAVAAATPLRHGLAASKLKVGILLPRSGPQGQIGADCLRGVEVGVPLLRAKGFPELELMHADTETKVDVARSQAAKLISSGAQLIIGCFDSGATMAAAQVCEQNNIPLVVNIAAVPKLTELGYKWVFRNFPTGPMIVKDAFLNQKELFAIAGRAPKTVALLHVNDTFGTSLAGALFALAPRFKMPYKIVEKVAYNPYGREFAGEIRKAKASKAEAVWMVSRLNDAIALTREMVKQRYEPMGIMSTGPGWYEDAYLRAMGKYGDDVVSLVPWHDATKPMSRSLAAAFAQRFPNRNLGPNHSHTFEALLVASDAFKRAGTTKNTALQAALQATDIKDNVSTGPGIKFNAKGQNPETKNSGVQNRGGKPLVILPKRVAVTKPIWPMRGWRKRG